MTIQEASEHTINTIAELRDARTLQAVLTLMITISALFLIVSDKEIPEFLLSVWLLLIGMYIPLPKES